MLSNKINKRRCRKCNSSQIYIRLSLNERVCKQCGYIEKIELDGGKE